MRKTWLFFVLFAAISGMTNAQITGRKAESVNEVWRFKKGNETEAKNISFNDKDWQTVNLPHTWNTEDIEDKDISYYQGIGWYRKTIKINDSLKNKKIYLYFKAAGQMVSVYVNGKPAGEHKGSYTAFCFDITDLVHFDPATENENLIAVKADNSINDDIPPVDGGFIYYGGIHRDVYLISVNRVHFDMQNYASAGVFVKTPRVNEVEAEVEIRGAVQNDDKVNRKVLVIHKIIDQTGNVIAQYENPLTLKAGVTTSFLVEKKKLKRPQLWSPDHPYLYQLRSTIVDSRTNKEIDNIVNPLAFRWFKFDPGHGFELNGKPLKLAGANRHQDFKGIGNAIPREQNVRDMQLLKDMGANFVRISHYPQDQELLDACDRLGLIAWEEIPIVTSITLTDGFFNTSVEMLKEMIRQHYNHPSIVMWGYMNEVLQGFHRIKTNDSTTYLNRVLELATTLEKTARTEDPQRYTIMALDYDPTYNRSQLADIPMVIGWNLYMGWYYENFDDFGKFLDKEHKLYPNRPILISEFGAGSEQRVHSYAPKRFDHSMEWQQLFIESYLKQINAREYIAGFAQWNLIDFHQQTGFASAQYNSKGILTMDRKKKDIYWLHQAYLLDRPVLHIATTGFDFRTGSPVNKEDSFCLQPVKIYSNLPYVEMFLNGKSLGVKNVIDKVTVFDVPFVAGSNAIAVYGTADKSKIADVCHIDFKMQPYAATSISFREIGINVGSNCYFVDDKTNYVWDVEKPYTLGSMGYIGGTAYSEWNGWPGVFRDLYTDQNQLFQTMRIDIKAYKFDVTDGFYTIELLFAAPRANTDHIFDVSVNHETVLKNLDLVKDYGEWQAVKKTFTVETKNNSGVEIEFIPVKGRTALSGIRLVRR